MSEKITEEELNKLEEFIGYGKPNAEVIFFGLEEAGGGIENLKKRLCIDEYDYLDCKRFHLDYIAENKKYKLHSEVKDRVAFQSVWKFMSYIMLKLDGKKDSEIFYNDSILLRKYQNNILGSKSNQGKTLLTEIYPIPCSSLKLWGTKKENYKEIIPRYKDKKSYRERVFQKRIEIFNNLLNSKTFKAHSIICYGKTHWNKFEKFFSEFHIKFEEKNFSKPTKKGILQNRINVYLLPFFGNGQVSYKFLEEIVQDIKKLKE